MKLICLNLWGGKFYKPLVKFLRDHSNDVDIFCFQETLHALPIKKLTGKIFKDSKLDLYEDLQKILKDHNSYFAEMIDLLSLDESDFNAPLGQSIFIKKEFSVKASGDIFVHGEGYDKFDHSEGFPNSPRNVQYISFEKNKKTYWVFNYHGVWVPGPKVDNEHRLLASQKIHSFVDSKSGAKIFCGDFNLLPDTKSLKILTHDMRNLIKEKSIKSTRSKYYDKPLSPMSDYMIVSPDLRVLDFKVLNDQVSDHLPLYIEFE